MKFHFDAYDRADSPILVLCNPTDKPLGEIFNWRELNISLCFTDISELSFEISQFYDDAVTGEKLENTLYSKLHEGREILVSDIMVRDERNSSADRDLGYFIISDISEETDGDNAIKSVTARSCEMELQMRALHYVDGTFKIYEEGNDSCLINQILKHVRKWTVGTISNSVADMYRTFDYEASLNIYDFLMTSFAESCNCIIEYDILNRVINIYDKSTYLNITTQKTNIAISLEDIIDNMSVDTGIDGLYTALYVPPDGDLNIASVNPARENIIYNFDYYKTTDWMSQELIDALDKCEIAHNLASTVNKKYVSVESPLSAIGDTKDIIYKDDGVGFKQSVYNTGIKYNDKFYYNAITPAGEQEVAPEMVTLSGDGAIQIDSGKPFSIESLSLFGKSTQNGTPTPTSPISIENIVNPTISTTGKNLFDIGTVNDYLVLPVSNPNVVNFTLSDNALSGITNLNGTHAVYNTKLKFKSGTYTFSSVNPIGLYRYVIRAYDASGNILTASNLINNWTYNTYYQGYYKFGKTSTAIIPDNVAYWNVGFVFMVKSGEAETTSVYSDIQIELGSTATAYEPYKSGGSATINRTLCGIGDVKDELIVNKDGTGKFVQRINTIVLDGVNRGVDRCQVASSGEYAALIEHLTGTQQGVLGVHMLNSHFITNAGETLLGQTYLTYYGRTIVLVHPDQSLTTPALWNNWLAEQNTAGTPVTIQYELATPIETDLTAEEVNAILSLKTFEPCTVVQNDKGAEMTVRYLADRGVVSGDNIYHGDGKWKLAKKTDSVVLTSSSPLELYKYNSDYMCFRSNQLMPYRAKGTETLFTNAQKLADETAVVELSKEGYSITDYDDSDIKHNVWANGSNIKNKSAISISALQVKGRSWNTKNNATFDNPGSLLSANGPFVVGLKSSTSKYTTEVIPDSENITLRSITGINSEPEHNSIHDTIKIDFGDGTTPPSGTIENIIGQYEFDGTEDIYKNDKPKINSSGITFSVFGISIPSIKNVFNRHGFISNSCSHTTADNPLVSQTVLSYIDDGHDGFDGFITGAFGYPSDFDENLTSLEFVVAINNDNNNLGITEVDQLRNFFISEKQAGRPVTVLYQLAEDYVTKRNISSEKLVGLKELFSPLNTMLPDINVTVENCSTDVRYDTVILPAFTWCVNRNLFKYKGNDIDEDIQVFKDWLDDNNNAGKPVTLEYLRRMPSYIVFDDTTQTQLNEKYPDGGVLATGTSLGGVSGTSEVYDRIISSEYTPILVNKFSISVDVYNEKDGGSAPTDGTATYFPTSGQTTGDFYLADHNYTKNLGGVDTVIVTPNNVDIYKFDGSGYELTDIDNITVSEVLITALKYEKEKQSYIESVITTLKDADLVNYDAQRSAIISSPATDEIKNQALAIINEQIAKTKASITKWSKILEDKNKLIKRYTDRLEVIAKRIRFEYNLSQELLDELYCFIREGEYSDDNLAVTDIMSYAEEIDQSMKLFTQAQEVLKQVSTPSKEFSIEVGSALYDKEFEKLSHELNTGAIIGVFDTNDNLEEYVLKQIDINDENKTVDLTFGNRLRLSDPQSAYADLYENISKTSNTVDYIKQTFDFKEANKELASINEFRNSSLDLSRNAIVSSKDEDMVIDTNGLKGRKRDAGTGGFDPEQLWITHNALAFSDDGFSTVKTAVGKIPIPAGMLDNDSLVYKYGINGEVIIGKILLGERAVIGDASGNVNISGDGIEILNGKLTVKDDDGNTIMSGSGLNADKLTVGNIMFEKKYDCTYEYFNSHRATGSNADNMGLYMSIFFGLGYPVGSREYKAAQDDLNEIGMTAGEVSEIVSTMNGVFDPDGDGVIGRDEAYIYHLFAKYEDSKRLLEQAGHTATIPEKIEYEYNLTLDRSLARPINIHQQFNISDIYVDGLLSNNTADQKTCTTDVGARGLYTDTISSRSLSSTEQNSYPMEGMANEGVHQIPEWYIGTSGIEAISGFTSGPVSAHPQGGGDSEYRSHRLALTVRYKDTNGYVRQKSWLDIVYPIGSVALSATNKNPGLTWGGRWISISSIGGQYAWKRIEDE